MTLQELEQIIAARASASPCARRLPVVTSKAVRTPGASVAAAV